MQWIRVRCQGSRRAGYCCVTRARQSRHRLRMFAATCASFSGNQRVVKMWRPLWWLVHILENRHIFMGAGGEVYEYIPCFNNQLARIEFFAQRVTENL